MAELKNLAFNVEEYRSRLERVQDELAKRDLDALLCHVFANINYLSGVESIGYYGYGHFMLLVPRAGGPTLFSSDFEIHNAKISSWTQDNASYALGTDHIEAIRKLLLERGLADKRLGVEQNHHSLTISDYIRLRELLPQATFVDATGIVEAIRRIKSSAELSYMRRAAELSSAGVKAAVEVAAEGKTDNDLVAAGYHAMISGGSEYFGLAPIVTVGKRSGIPHSTFCRVPLERGDAILLEFGGCVRRYCAPIMRGAVIGPPSDELKRMEKLKALRNSYTAQRNPGLVTPKARKG